MVAGLGFLVLLYRELTVVLAFTVVSVVGTPTELTAMPAGPPTELIAVFDLGAFCFSRVLAV